MAEQTKVPQIRFKGFSEEWVEKTLGEIGSVAMNKRIFKHQTCNVGDIPFYKIGTFGGEPDAFITRDLFEKYKKLYPYPDKGDLLISAAGSIGRIVEYKGCEEYFQDSNIVWLKHDQRIENQFLKQFYLFVKWAGLEGSTIKRLYNKNILDTRIDLPSVEEQSRIGAYFTELDQMIELHQRKHEKLVTLKKAMLKKMFPQNGATTPEVRFKGFSEPWAEKKIEKELAIIKTGFPFKSNDFDDCGTYLVITNGNIQNESPYVDNSLGNRICITNGQLVDEYGLNKGDILVTMDGSVGRAAKVIHENQILAQRVGRLIPQTDPEFLYQSLNTGEFLKEMTLVSHGGTIKHISLSEIGDYSLKIPSEKHEQQKIGTYFRQLDELIAQHETQLEKLKQIKSACLERMFV